MVRAVLVKEPVAAHLRLDVVNDETNVARIELGHPQVMRLDPLPPRDPRPAAPAKVNTMAKVDDFRVE